MFSDLHNHTCHFSPDAEMTIDELIDCSKERGMSYVGITEHYEYDNPDPNDNVQVFDLDEYQNCFSEWRQNAFTKGLNLLMGIEFGYQTHTAAKIDQISLALPFDIVILSNHLFRGRDVYFSNECYHVDRKDRHKEYIGTMAQMAENCSNYDIIAHYDYINRYNSDKNETVFYDDCPKEFDRLFEAMISKDKALEINTRSIESQIRKFSPYIMPDEKIIKRYLKMGGELITLGSDSHSKDTLGIHFDSTAQYLKSLGVNEIYRYVSHKPYAETI